MERRLEFVSNYKRESILLSDIQYIEVFNRKCYINVKSLSEPLETYAKLSDLEKQLDNAFIKVSRSCIVSFWSIKSFVDTSQNIVLIDGHIIFPSKSLYTIIKDRYVRRYSIMSLGFDSSTKGSSFDKYVVLQVVLTEKVNSGVSCLSNLQATINKQADKGYRLHTISTSQSDPINKVQATLVFERIN